MMAVADEQRDMDGERLRLEDEEVQRDRDAGHSLQNPIEARRQQQAKRQREQPTDADDQRGLREHVFDHAHAREAERSKRGDLAEALVHRDRQQDGDQQHGKRHGHRRQHARDLAEVREASLLEPADNFRVGRGSDLREQRANGRRRFVCVACRCHEDQVGLGADVSAAGRLERIERAAGRGFVRRLEGELRDPDDLQAGSRERLQISDARRAHRDLTAWFESGLGCDLFVDDHFVCTFRITSAQDRPGSAKARARRICRTHRRPLKRRAERLTRGPVDPCGGRAHDECRLH